MISICLTLSMHKLKNMPTFTKKHLSFGPFSFLCPTGTWAATTAMNICQDFFSVVSLNSQSKGEKCSSRWEEEKTDQTILLERGIQNTVSPHPSKIFQFFKFLLLKHNLLTPKIPKNVRPHSGNSIENASLFFSPSKNAVASSKYK